MSDESGQAFEVLIIGGGVIGLSLAYELVRGGHRVCVVDRQEFGRESSWAGAGIIPPGSWYHDHPAVTSLAMLGYQLLPEWTDRLREDTGIDNGWRVSGGIYLTAGQGVAEQAGTVASLERWQRLGIESQPISASDVAKLEPRLADRQLFDPSRRQIGHYVPGEAQLRNPRHLRALITACQRRGACLVPSAGVREFAVVDDRIQRIVTGQGDFSADQVILTAGCWTGYLAGQLGHTVPTRPVRGQIVMLRPSTPQPVLRHVLHWGGLYIVSRDDGCTLVGSTVEEAGFVNETTSEAIEDLTKFAGRVGLTDLTAQQSWSGLRPATADGLPILGRLPGLENAWVATGHYRAGLQMAASTAVTMAALIEGRSPPLDAIPLAVERDWPSARGEEANAHR